MGYLRINRAGIVSTIQTSYNQCREVGHELYRYYVAATCIDSNTDKNNWIIDHNAINSTVVDYFTRKVDSCEGICKDLASELEKLLEDNGNHVVDLYIKLEPVLPDNSPTPAYTEFSLSGKFI